MEHSQPLCASILDKIHEQIERTEHLIHMVPSDQMDWTPAFSGAWPAGTLVCHLALSISGFCAVLAAIEPERLSHFSKLRTLVNERSHPNETLGRIELLRAHIDEGFALLTDADLSKIVPTVFVKHGESVLTLLLGNLEHLINHKRQLFSYLRLMGVDVSSRDLYRFRKDS